MPLGVGGAPVYAIVDGDLALVASDIDRLPSVLHRDDLERHNRVNLAVLERGLCVPWRYGSMLAGSRAAVDLLRGEGERWRTTCRRLDGCVELSVKVLLPPEPMAATCVEAMPDAGPGTLYLRRQQSRQHAERRLEQRGQRLLDQLQRDLADLTRAMHGTIHAGLVACNALVDRHDFGAAAGRAGALAEASTGRWSISQPWPPYSFTGDGMDGNA